MYKNNQVFKNNKVGLVTYYKENYGSFLQCFATKYFLEKNGFTCVLLDKKNTILYAKFISIITHLFRSIMYKGYFSNYFQMKKSMQKDKNNLNTEASVKMNDAVFKELSPRRLSSKELKKIGRCKEYIAFIAGSDQIWNPSISINRFYGLEFTAQSKRIALSPSIGVSTVPRFNEKLFIDIINGFEKISVRERTGKELIERFYNGEIIVLSDPTVLLNKSDWCKIIENIKLAYSDYIFIHFLNKPKSQTVSFINNISKEYKLKALIFSYSYDVYELLEDSVTINGDPFEYLSLIKNSNYIFTDSYHTTLFSLYFDKNFMVFHRQYNHSFPQTSRIIEVLRKYNLENRLFIDEEKASSVLKEKLHYDSSILSEERKQLRKYLLNELNKRKDE